MDLHLAGKTAFVSGSTQGIGYAIAKELLTEGVSVTINGRDAVRVEEAVGSLATAVPGAVVSGIAADFGDVEQVARLVESLGEVDILFNNVGLFEIKAFGEISDE